MHLAVSATVAIAMFALWVRRHTWRIPWEAGATANVALQSAKVLVVCSPIDRLIGTPLHAVTGLWNCEELISHLAYVGGLTALMYTTVGRLTWPPGRLRRFMRQRIELPAALFVPITISLFIAAGCGDRDVPDLLLVRTTPLLAMYWLMYIGACLWLLGHAAWALIILRRDPRGSGASDAFLAAIAVSFLAAGSFIFDTDPIIRWALVRAELIGYALAAIYSWHRKTAALRATQREIKRPGFQSPSAQTQDSPADNPGS